MNFFSSGKLMITSEYVVLSGAKAIAVPTKKGQHMSVKKTPDAGVVNWKSIDYEGNTWFSSRLDLNHLKRAESKIEERLQKLLGFIQMHSEVVNFEIEGFDITTTLQFDQTWGLGSSSTLVSNLAKWAQVDGIKLLHSAFAGSGYDVAVGLENQAITYQIEDSTPKWELVSWTPGFSKQLFFVHLGKKQNSETEVNRFEPALVAPELVDWFSAQTDEILQCKTIEEFSERVERHEDQLSILLKRPTIKESLFQQYPKAIKSLGAWGGDFVLVVGDLEQISFFRDLGYRTIIPWEEMIN